MRGLEYYTGALFEVVLAFETKDEQGRPVRFGSVGGGGRYDGLIARFAARQSRQRVFPSACRGSRRRLRIWARARCRKRAGGGDGVRPGTHQDYQRMVAALRNARHPRRALSRYGKNGRAAQIRGSAWFAVRGDPGRRRESQGKVHRLIEAARAAAAIASNRGMAREPACAICICEREAGGGGRRILGDNMRGLARMSKAISRVYRTSLPHVAALVLATADEALGGQTRGQNR